MTKLVLLLSNNVKSIITSTFVNELFVLEQFMVISKEWQCRSNNYELTMKENP